MQQSRTSSMTWHSRLKRNRKSIVCVLAKSFINETMRRKFREKRVYLTNLFFLLWAVLVCVWVSYSNFKGEVMLTVRCNLAKYVNQFRWLSELAPWQQIFTFFSSGLVLYTTLCFLASIMSSYIAEMLADILCSTAHVTDLPVRFPQGVSLFFDVR